MKDQMKTQNSKLDIMFGIKKLPNNKTFDHRDNQKTTQSV